MKHRTALITAGSLAAVVLAGGAAVAASLGILGASASDDVGNLSAAVAVTPAVSPTATPAELVAGADTVVYEVADSGSVTVTQTGDGLVVDSVDTNPGWTSTTGTSNADTVVVDFAGPTIGHRLTVTRIDGTLVPVVTDLTVAAPPAPTTAAGRPGSGGGGYEDDDHDEYEDDDAYEDDDHDDDEDDDEYEGGDWDD